MQRALGEAEGLYNAEDYAAAAEAAQAALGNPKLMACTAVIRGKALLAPVLKQLMDSTPGRPYPTPDAFREPHRMFSLATQMDPGNKEAQEELAKIGQLVEMVLGTLSSVAQAEAIHLLLEGLQAAGATVRPHVAGVLVGPGGETIDTLADAQRKLADALEAGGTAKGAGGKARKFK